MASGAMRSWLGICRHATCTPQLRDGRVYLFGSLFKVLVLPEACDVPSRLLESFIGVPVASLVSLDLCSPVGGVLLWPGPMDRATIVAAAHRLELVDLYSQADALRELASQLRHDARNMQREAGKTE